MSSKPSSYPTRTDHTRTELLSGFYFFYYATIGAFIPFWSLYLEQTGFNKADIGLLMAVTMLARVFAPSIWGYLADATGKRMLWIRLATIAELLAWLAIFFLPANFMSFFVVMLFFSFFQNAIIPQFEAVTLFWLGKARDRYGQVRLWGSVGFICTVFGLGVLFDYVSLSLLPVVLAVLAFVCFINACLIPEPQRPSHAQPDIQQLNEAVSLEPALDTDLDVIDEQHAAFATRDSIQSSVSSDSITKTPNFMHKLRQSSVMWFFIAQFVLLLSHAPFYSFYSNYLAEYGYSKTSIGLLWSAGVIAEIILFTQSRWILKRYQEHWLICFCLLTTGLRWLLVALFPSSFVVQFAAQCVHAFSFALFQSVAMQLIFREFSEQQQGRAQALYSTFWGLGVATGSVLVGHYWDVTGGAFWFAVAGALVLVFGLVFAVMVAMRETNLSR